MAVIKALPAQILTFKGADTLVEGDFVVVDGSADMTVVKAGAGVEADGVVAVAPEFGLVSVLINKPVVELTAGGAVTAGQDLEIGASGVVTKATGVKVGVALKSATAGGKTWVALTV
jgi:tetrahydromethanopterin S-methyltransferase subunit H